MRLGLRVKLHLYTILMFFTGGRPMFLFDEAWPQSVYDPKPVYYAYDWFGRLWLAEDKFSVFRVVDESMRFDRDGNVDPDCMGYEFYKKHDGNVIILQEWDA